MKEFFISYTGADLPWAEWIATELHQAGYTTVFQEWDFHAGGNFVLEMHRAAKETKRTIAVLSQRYLDALFTNSEWAAAFAKDPQGKERLLVPVRIEDFKPDGLFAALIYIDLVGLSESDAKARLLKKIEATLNGASAGPRAKVAFPGTPSTPAPKATRYPGTVPPVCNLPQRNRNFTGRESLLDALRSSLESGKHTAITQAIYGLGGIGKSQLAIEYAWRYSAGYDVVWWIRSEEPSTLASDYAALAKKLNLPESEAQEQAVVIEAVREWLNHNTGWLLIFDNAKDAASIKSYLPTGTGGHILITSRFQNWSTIGSPLRIEVWSTQESIAFLHRRTGQSDDGAAGTLAETLGNLPLALEQAAAYCNATGTSYGDYLHLFTTRHRELWKDEEPPDNYPDTVATTWTLAFEEAAQTPFASDILNICSVVAPDAIPRTLITRALEHYADEGEAAAIDPLAINKAIKALITYSLITHDKEQLSIHRLVQMVAQERMEPEAIERCRTAAIKALSEQFPDEGYSNPACWPECAALMPHAETLFNAVTDDTSAWEELALLLNNSGCYHYGRAAYAEAEPLYRRALAIREKTLGSDHPDVATSLNNLAALLYAQGKYAEAEPLYRRALAIREKALGPDHPSVATGLNNLAELLRVQGNYAEAEPLYRRALAIREKVLGPDHPNVATSLNNLAELLRVQGNYAEAESLYRRALAIDEKALGPDHPGVATDLNNLAELLRVQGNYTEAEPLIRCALVILENSLGPDHPGVATSLNNLGLLLKTQGNYTEAEPLIRRALAIDEKALGSDHPSAITIRNNLNGLLKKL